MKATLKSAFKVGSLAIGAICVIGSAVTFILISNSEKRAVYVLGHWFDADYEIAIPLLVAGLILLVAPRFMHR